LSSHAGEGAEMKHCPETLNEETYFKQDDWIVKTQIKRKERRKKIWPD